MNNRRFRKIVGVLGCIAVFFTSYALILPAVTLESHTQEETEEVAEISELSNDTEETINAGEAENIEGTENTGIEEDIKDVEDEGETKDVKITGTGEDNSQSEIEEEALAANEAQVLSAESDKVSNTIVFLHQPQDNNDFTKQNNYRPQDGFGTREPTNYVKFVLILENEDGSLKKITGADGQIYPDVELPEGSTVPERYEFEVGEGGVLNVTGKTFAGISVPGYSFDTTYAYFGWTSNSDMEESNMAIVQTFKNFGRMSSRYNNTYYSVIGYTTTRGNPGYDDYSYVDFGNAGKGYYAYNPTGCLMLVLKPVGETIAYKTNYHNDFVPGGNAETNIVDITDARMVQNEDGSWYGEAIMTDLDVNDISKLTPPGGGWTFAGWYDSCDAQGNGEGNRISGVREDEDGKTYYFAVDPSGNRIKITQNNDFYARWETSITIRKVESGTTTTLSGAEFDLYRPAASGETGVTISGIEEAVVKVNFTVITTGEDGMAAMENLWAGDYYLLETKAPDGYQLLDTPVHFTIGANGITLNGGANVQTEGMTITVANPVCYELPQTGGYGTLLYTFGGLALVAVSLMYGCRKRRK